MNKCWDCKYFEYDESFDPDTGDEYQFPSCTKGNDCDDYDEETCDEFEEE